MTSNTYLLLGADASIGYGTAQSFADVGFRIVLAARDTGCQLPLGTTLRQSTEAEVGTVQLAVSWLQAGVACRSGHAREADLVAQAFWDLHNATRRMCKELNFLVEARMRELNKGDRVSHSLTMAILPPVRKAIDRIVDFQRFAGGLPLRKADRV